MGWGTAHTAISFIGLCLLSLFLFSSSYIFAIDMRGFSFPWDIRRHYRERELSIYRPSTVFFRGDREDIFLSFIFIKSWRRPSSYAFLSFSFEAFLLLSFFALRKRESIFYIISYIEIFYIKCYRACHAHTNAFLSSSFLSLPSSLLFLFHWEREYIWEQSRPQGKGQNGRPCGCNNKLPSPSFSHEPCSLSRRIVVSCWGELPARPQLSAAQAFLSSLFISHLTSLTLSHHAIWLRQR